MNHCPTSRCPSEGFWKRPLRMTYFCLDADLARLPLSVHRSFRRGNPASPAVQVRLNARPARRSRASRRPPVGVGGAPAVGNPRPAAR